MTEHKFRRLEIIVHPWIEDSKTTLANQDIKYEKTINGRNYDYREWESASPDWDMSLIEPARETVMRHIKLFPNKIIYYGLFSKSEGYCIEFRVDEDERLKDKKFNWFEAARKDNSQ